VESRNGHELVKLEGAEAIQELQRMAQMLKPPLQAVKASEFPDNTAEAA
jgi:hypothetical protein